MNQGIILWGKSYLIWDRKTGWISVGRESVGRKECKPGGTASTLSLKRTNKTSALLVTLDFTWRELGRLQKHCVFVMFAIMFTHECAYFTSHTVHSSPAPDSLTVSYGAKENFPLSFSKVVCLCGSLSLNRCLLRTENCDESVCSRGPQVNFQTHSFSTERGPGDLGSDCHIYTHTFFF